MEVVHVSIFLICWHSYYLAQTSGLNLSTQRSQNGSHHRAAFWLGRSLAWYVRGKPINAQTSFLIGQKSSFVMDTSNVNQWAARSLHCSSHARVYEVVFWFVGSRVRGVFCRLHSSTSCTRLGVLSARAYEVCFVGSTAPPRTAKQVSNGTFPWP